MANGLRFSTACKVRIEFFSQRLDQSTQSSQATDSPRQAPWLSPGSGLIEAALSLKVEEQLPTVDIVQDKVQLVAGLERVVQPHQEGVCHVLEEHVPLRHDMLHLVPPDDGLLGEHFDSVVLARLLVSTQIHLAAGRGVGREVRVHTASSQCTATRHKVVL